MRGVSAIFVPAACFDELSAADIEPQGQRLLRLARAIDADAALLFVAIRSDAYSVMPSQARSLGIDQVP
jgi:hypothetical protein